jgi:acyl carrier protein
MTDDAKDKALRILADVSGLAADDIQPKMDLAADLGIDSPKALQLLVDLEDTLDIEISDEDAAAMETVSDILRYLEAR